LAATAVTVPAQEATKTRSPATAGGAKIHPPVASFQAKAAARRTLGIFC